ncbi:MAG: pantoate--beta-alanine ligase [Flavobacteriia bacterium]|jgi:pantoate--beta-alanine ligase|nr:pantoate--beta-alanine ligase [Cryomorphaceae bacterium]
MGMPTVYTTAHVLSSVISAAKKTGDVGFVPTMGALHEGHLSLVQKALEQNSLVVVSIFVNPTQFNNASDLSNYPRTLNTDLELMSVFDRVIVYAPGVEDIYPEHDFFEPIDLGELDMRLEGAFRPGHFQGVVHVVRNLFHIVQPHRAYFGEKDFQQLAVIRRMVKLLNFSIEIISCPTYRSVNGLALSSRNMRLTHQGRAEALIISETLNYMKGLDHDHPPSKVMELGHAHFSKGKLTLEYLEIVDAESLMKLTDEWSDHAVCCIAAYCEDVRLIDNLAM